MRIVRYLYVQSLKMPTFYLAVPKNSNTFAVAFIKWDLVYHLPWRDGRVVDYNGLENRRTERYRGFESLSLRKQGCKSTSYVIYTLYYTRKSAINSLAMQQYL